MPASKFLFIIKIVFICILIACGLVQIAIDDKLQNLTCSLIAIISSAATIQYTFEVGRFRRTPLSSVMLFGYNVSALSASLLIQTLNGVSLTYNLTAALPTFLALASTQFVAIAAHWVYLHSELLLGLRFRLARNIFRPLGLLSAPSNFQLWLFGLVGCVATIVSARNYTNTLEYGDASNKFLLGYVPFAVAPFLIPLRTSLLGGSTPVKGTSLSLMIYAPLLIAVAMANNARATFSSGFLTLFLCMAVAVLSGNLLITRKVVVRGLLIMLIGIPAFSILSDLATAMVIARDERTNVSPIELINITLANFQDKTLIDDRRRRDAAVLGGEYNEIYVANPILARFVYTKFADVNMTNALSLSDAQIAEVRKSTWTRILAMLPTPILNYFKINVVKSDIQFSSGDVYSYIARGLELGAYTTGSEVPDGMTIFGLMFWPVLAVLLIIQFVIYDAMSAFDNASKLRVSALALLNIVPIFTLGVMQESVSNQIISIVREIPQLILLYLVITGATKVFDQILQRGGARPGDRAFSRGSV